MCVPLSGFYLFSFPFVKELVLHSKDDKQGHMTLCINPSPPPGESGTGEGKTGWEGSGIWFWSLECLDRAREHMGGTA